MNWLKNKISHTVPETSVTGHSSAGSNNNINNGKNKYGFCNYVFDDDAFEKQLSLHINVIKKNILNGDSDLRIDGAVCTSEFMTSEAKIQQVCEQMKSMISLIIAKNLTFALNSSLLEFFYKEKFFDLMLRWTQRCFHQQESIDDLVEEQLILYDILTTPSNQQLLTDKQLLNPLLHLLKFCSSKVQNDLNSCSTFEGRLLLTLHQLCIGITSIPEVLDLLFDDSCNADKFPVFNLLIPFVHREGVVGQQARDALLLIMSLSAKHERIGLFIANVSNFCPVLATGLSGLYSSLPCKLEYPSDDWHCISDEDVSNMPDLKMFLNSLEFCNAVIQVSHPAICNKLLDYVMVGFLHPVIGPALNQFDWDLVWMLCDCDDLSVSTIEEVVAATAYLDLFIRKITEPSLLKVFLDFILLGKVEEIFILDLFITRVSSQLTRLCVVTLVLLYSLVDLNCEDVMFHLIFKHIVPGRHIMLSQHRALKEVDYYAADASKFLSMIPECCNVHQADNVSIASSEASNSSIEDEKSSKFERFNIKGKKRISLFSTLSPLSRTEPGQSTPLSPQQLEDSSYEEYLTWAHHMISSCKEACFNWSSKYDGVDPSVFLTTKEMTSDDVEKNPEASQNVNNDCSAYVVDFPLEASRDVFNDNEKVNHASDSVESCQDFGTKPDGLCTFLTLLNDFTGSEEPASLPDILKGIDELYDKVSLKNENPTGLLKKDSSSFTQKLSVVHDPFVLSIALNGSGKPTLGPFLEALFDRVERMVQSTLYVNLQLTSLVTRLSCYPHPLLRSLILSHAIVFQPSIKSFLQVLSAVKNKIDDCLTKFPDRKALLTQAFQFLVYRMSPVASHKSFGRSRRKSIFSEMFGKDQGQTRLFISQGNPSAVYTHRVGKYNKEEDRETIEKKNAIYAALIFKEFLKELAAISQEHAIICLS